MIKNKAGLSTVVTTLIIILLVLVAIGIIWVVLRPIFEGGSGEIDIGAKCLNVEVRATGVTTCSSTACTVALARSGSSTEEIAGVKLVFSNNTVSPVDVSDIADYPNDVPALVGASTGALTIANLAVNPDKVEITVYFKDESGNELLCPSSTEFNF